MGLEELNNLLVEFYEKMSSWEHSVVRGKSLTLPQMHALEIIGTHGPIRMKELAQKQGVTTGTMTVVVDKLEKKGLILRAQSKEDRRSITVCLTELGEKAFKEHHKMHQTMTAEITTDLGPEEIKQLEDTLKKLISRL